MNKSKTNLWAALLTVQQQIGNILRSAENPYFNSRYVPLDKLLSLVKPILNDGGLILLQSSGATTENELLVITTIVHVETGEEVSTTLGMPIAPNPQSVGSGLTYGWRYSLMGILAIAPTDDDAEAAMSKSRSALPRVDPHLKIKTVDISKWGRHLQTEWSELLRVIDTLTTDDARERAKKIFKKVSPQR